MVSLIGAVTTKGDLTIRTELDENRYATGRKVTDEQMESLAIERAAFHGDWCYTLALRLES